MSTLIVGIVLLIIIVFIVKSMIKDKKSCHHECSNCSGCASNKLIFETYKNDYK